MRKLVDYDIATEMYASGETLAAIGARFGVKKSAISSGLTIRGVLSRRKSKVRLTPSIMDLAYIAGLFDGEGYVTITLSKSDRVDQYWLQIGLGMTDRMCIEFLRASFGIGHIGYRKKTEQTLTLWRWIAISGDAAHVLRLIQPYLRVKAEVAALGLEFQERIQERNNVAWRADMKEKVRVLNRET